MTFVMKWIENFYSEYSGPLWIFVFSRFLIFGTFLALKFYQVANLSFLQWDTYHYFSIIENGYTFGGSEGTGNTIAFFPFYPIILSLWQRLINFDLLPAALILSLILGIMGAMALYRYVSLIKDKKIATQAVWLFSLAPMSIFFSAAYTENLLVLLVILAFLFMHQKRFVTSAIVIGLASITKIFGVFLIPILLYEMWRQRVTWTRQFAALVLAALPFLLFMYYQMITFGNPLAFQEGLKLGWEGKMAAPWETIGVLLRVIFDGDGSQIIWAVQLFFITFGLVTLVKSYNRIPKTLLWFSLVLILFVTSINLSCSIARYLLVFLPFYIIWGEYLKKHPHSRPWVYSLSAVWMIVSSLVFLSGGNVL